MRRSHAVIQRALLTLGVSLLVMTGCKDRIADPTQGFVDILTGDVSNVEVFLDDVSMGAVDMLGPLPQGTYTVRVFRECYQAVPSSLEITVDAGGRAAAAFAMTVGQSGAVHVTATDEILGSEITGAEILLDLGSGFTPTGVTTPGTVTGVPCGNVSLAVRRSGFEDSRAQELLIVPFETADAALEMGPLRAVLAEMFTFTLCIGCPPAAGELELIHESRSDTFYVIEWHSQCCFPLYDERWRDRQEFYFGSVNPPKPQVGFQGGTLAAHDPPFLLGGADATLLEYQPRVEDYLDVCGNDCPVALKVLGSIGSTEADADVRVLWRGGSIPADLVLRVLLVEDHVTGVGGYGEPPGYSGVPRDMYEQSVSFSSPGEVLTITPPTFPVQAGWDVDELHFVAYVQSDLTHEILAVGGF